MSPDPAAVRVREERDEDASKVFAIHRAAFGQSAEAELVDRLRATAVPQISLVAELAADLPMGPVGHVFLSPVRLGSCPDRAVSERVPAPALGGLAPLGVLPEAQARGVGTALVRAAITRAHEIGWKAVVLLGEPAYYARFGFELAATRGLRYVSEAFDAGFQLLELEPNALAACRGFVHYHPAFDDL